MLGQSRVYTVVVSFYFILLVNDMDCRFACIS